MSVDYFGTYFTKEGFDFPRLINDDFFQPVRILFQQRHFVSAAKLLLVAIDSIAFVEYGEVTASNVFVRWLGEYADLAPLGVTADELWEHRNALLHMSSLESRKVLAGKSRRLIFYVGQMPPGVNLEGSKTGYYDLQKLIVAFGKACGKWIETYETNRSKIDDFVTRYDLITSDARMFHVAYGSDNQGSADR